MMLAANPEIEITATYNTAAALLEGLEQSQPDVLLLDILLPDKQGNDIAPLILKKYPKVRIVALTSLDAPAVVKNMMQHGCMGYLLKGTDGATLLKAVQSAYKGEEFIEPALKEHLLQNMLKAKKTTPNPGMELTEREKEILLLIAEEYTTQEIADKLFIAFRTVETHRYSLLHKLNAKNTAGLVRMAIAKGIIDP